MRGPAGSLLPKTLQRRSLARRLQGPRAFGACHRGVMASGRGLSHPCGIERTEDGSAQRSVLWTTLDSGAFLTDTPAPIQQLRDLNASLDRRVFDLQGLIKAGSALHSKLDIEELCALLSAMVRERVGVTSLAILLHDEGGRRVVLRKGGPEPGSTGLFFDAQDGLLWRMLLAGEPFSVVDLAGEARFPDHWRRYGLGALQGVLWVPMVLPERVVGVLSLGPKEDGTPQRPEDLEFLSALARQAAIAFHTALLYESNHRARRELDRSLHKLSMLFDVTRALGAVSDLTRLLRMILERAVQSVDAERGSLMLLDETTDELVVRVVLGLADKEQERRINDGEFACTRLKRGEGVAGNVLASGKACMIGDVEKDGGFSRRGGNNTRSILCVPLMVEEECLGVINMTNKTTMEAFRQEDEDILGTLAGQAAVAIARTRLYEAAITDGLTRLYIRRYVVHRLHEEVKKSRRYGSPLSIIMCDIDHFKRVNDTHGHPAGDAVIVSAAQNLRAGLRQDVDAAGRYGGEEFLLILPHTNGAGALLAAERLRVQVASTQVPIGDGKTLAVTMSFGAAELDTTSDDDVDALMKRADVALYASKHGGRNRATLAPPLDLAPTEHGAAPLEG